MFSIYRNNSVPILYKWIETSYNITLGDVGFYVVNILLFVVLFSNITVVQQQFMLAMAQQNQSNSTADGVESTRDRIIPQAQEVNESNLELIKICTTSPNPECDNTMIIIHNDCISYPSFVVSHIPSCDDSRLISYLLARGLLE
jgi:hypothetical protein